MSLFYEIMYMLVKNYRLTEAHEKEIRHSRKLDTLSKITTYMREHYKEDLKLSDLAATFGYSDAYCRECFKKYAKINYKTYFADFVWHMTYRDLMNTDRT